MATITGHKDTKMAMRYMHLRAEDLVEHWIRCNVEPWTTPEVPLHEDNSTMIKMNDVGKITDKGVFVGS